MGFTLAGWFLAGQWRYGAHENVSTGNTSWQL